MSLRPRLVLTLVTVAVPLIAVLTWARGALDYRSEVEALQGFIEARMVDGRAACEADPARFPPPRGRPPRGPFDARRSPREAGPPGDPPEGAPIDLFAYSGDFLSANPRAPAFPPGLRHSLESGGERADERFAADGRGGIRVAVRMAWNEGPCAIVLAERRGRGPAWLSRNQLITASVLALVLTLAVFLAAGPLVQRVRKLTAEVRRSARDRYATQVTVAGRDEISELAREFNQAGAEVQRQFRELEAREQALRDFVANTTHDVMIPMTVLQGHLSALRDAEGRSDANLLRDAMQEVQYMTSVLQNLAASAKLEAGDANLESGEVALDALVERVAARHRPIGRLKGMELNFAVPEEGLRVRGDLTLLEQAVSNLVHNAVRHGVEGGHVAVLLEALPGAEWRLRILDDGPGIHAADIERMPQRFVRGDAARSRSPEGQGLGLHIVFEVARRHGFALELRRSEYGGLEVELRGSAL